jgi:pyruvate dehydrogenase E2 component (dihydrolipoamide acetyltransferase)
MPKMGISVESCVLAKWHKKKGDTVEKGGALFTYETDKTTVDEEAPVSGVLLDVFFAEGDDVPAMLNVAVIGEAGEDASAFAPSRAGTNAEQSGAAGDKGAPARTGTNGKDAPTVSAPAVAPTGGAKAGVSPRARALAARERVDASKAVPTGAEGRVTERDVRALLAAGGLSRRAGTAPVSDFGKSAGLSAAREFSGPEYTDEKLSGVRKFIAKSMLESLSATAQLTHTASFDATNVLAFRAFLKENGEKLGLPNITVNDILIYAAARVLKRHRACNAHFLGDGIRYFNTVHMGIAVDTERGLLVPTLRNAELKSLAQIAKEAKELAKASQAGTVAPDLLKGGTFTVSNLGALGIESFTPIINPPQTCILGVNTLVDSVKEENGRLVVYKRMPLSLTYNHQALDGAPASRFLSDLCKELTNFSLYLAVNGDMA